MNNSARSAGQAASTRRGPLAAFTVTVLEVPHSTTNATIQRTRYGVGSTLTSTNILIHCMLVGLDDAARLMMLCIQFWSASTRWATIFSWTLVLFHSCGARKEVRDRQGRRCTH